MWFRVSKLNFKTTWESSQKSLVTGASRRARRPLRCRKSWLHLSARTGLLALPFRFRGSPLSLLRTRWDHELGRAALPRRLGDRNWAARQRSPTSTSKIGRASGP